MKPESRTIFPSPDTLNNLEYGRFVLSNLAAKRAKQIKDGAPPLIKCESNHPLSIALAEIAAGKIKPILKTLDDPTVGLIELEPADDLRPNELGILLPALDEADAELLGVAALVGDDLEDDHEEAETTTLLSDLLGDDAEEDEVGAEADVIDNDGSTVSLNELAEEEGPAEDEEKED